MVVHAASAPGRAGLWRFVPRGSGSTAPDDIRLIAISARRDAFAGTASTAAFSPATRLGYRRPRHAAAGTAQAVGMASARRVAAEFTFHATRHYQRRAYDASAGSLRRARSMAMAVFRALPMFTMGGSIGEAMTDARRRRDRGGQLTWTHDDAHLLMRAVFALRPRRPSPSPIEYFSG